jgi:hypothetical protein
MTNSFKGKAKRLDAWDFGRNAKLIGRNVGEDELRAVVTVEASGSGFDAQGRLKMLFEPHRFYRELGERKRELAVTQGLAYERWGERPYPADSYPRLLAAIKIDRPGALRSASWGLAQIMGSNAKSAGYATAEDMIADFLDDEEKHLTAMVRFIISEALDDELRNHDWRGFARGYNGPGYAKHGYHTKLAAAFKAWQARPDAVAP